MTAVDQGAVLAWGLPKLRDLPWRHTRDPWAILVAEVMLQQTRAERVVPKWVQFQETYPTPVACATASLGDVLPCGRRLGVEPDPHGSRRHGLPANTALRRLPDPHLVRMAPNRPPAARPLHRFGRRSTRQAPYDGSERQARGRVLKALTTGAARLDALPGHVVAGLVADGLAVSEGRHIRLP